MQSTFRGRGIIGIPLGLPSKIMKIISKSSYYALPKATLSLFQNSPRLQQRIGLGVLVCRGLSATWELESSPARYMRVAWRVTAHIHCFKSCARPLLFRCVALVIGQGAVGRAASFLGASGSVPPRPSGIAYAPAGDFGACPEPRQTHTGGYGAPIKKPTE